MKIVNFEEIIDKYALAQFDIYFEKMGMYLRRWKLLKSKAGNFYIKSPQYPKESEFGTKTWHGYVDFEGNDRGKQFSSTVLTLLQPYLPTLRNSESPSF